MNRKFSVISAGLMMVLGVVILSTQAYARQPIAISIIGNGPLAGSTTACTNASNALCPVSDSCLCNASSGSAKTSLGGLGGATFVATTVIDLSAAVGDCDNTQGKVTITSGNHHNSLVLNYIGVACLFANPLSVINVSYAVDGAASSGKFSLATGTGGITGSENPSTGDILGNVNGNIQLP